MHRTYGRKIDHEKVLCCSPFSIDKSSVNNRYSRVLVYSFVYTKESSTFPCNGVNRQNLNLCETAIGWTIQEGHDIFWRICCVLDYCFINWKYLISNWKCPAPIKMKYYKPVFNICLPLAENVTHRSAILAGKMLAMKMPAGQMSFFVSIVLACKLE